MLEKTPKSPLDGKEIKPIDPKGNQPLNIHWKDWCWSWSSNTLAHWKRSWYWERLKVGGEGDNRGWDGWMASPTQWTWVWVDSVSWSWTGRPGVLQWTVAQRVTCNWATELNWAWPHTSEQDPISPSVSPIKKLPLASYPSTSECRQTENHHFRKLTSLIKWTTALSNSMKLWTMPWWTGHGGECCQNVVHWRRERQTTSLSLPSEPHEQYEKVKI